MLKFFIDSERLFFLCVCSQLKGFELPVEVSLELYAEKPVVLPFFTGHVAKGLLLHFIRQVDPSASSLLHELNFLSLIV